MVKDLQKKFILTAMTAITLLIVVLLGVINIFSITLSHDENNRVLDMLCDDAGDKKPMHPQDKDDKLKPTKPFGDRDGFISARYFYVIFSGDVAITTDVSRISSVEEETAVVAAREVLSKSEKGNYSGFLYKRVTRPDNTTLVLFLDTSQQTSVIFTTFIISLCAGLICWGLMLLLVVLLSKRAITPIAQNIEKQKIFVTNAGHEIKTPLAIILANTDAMELHNGENKWSKNIRAQAMRLSGLMQKLLTLSKMEEGNITIPFEEFDIGELTEDTIQAFYEPALLKGIEIEENIEKNVIINAGREYITQLLTVLMDNAVKYTQGGGKIKVDLTKQDKGCIIRVANTYPEIKNPEQLFDRFYRENDARTQKTGGYGIGLSVARAIVKQHHGSITAKSVAGQLTFTVKL